VITSIGRMRRFVLSVVLAAAMLVPLAAEAQTAPTLPDARASRFLVLGDLSFPGSWRPAVGVGGLYQISLAPMRSVIEDGFQSRTVPNWYLHLSATAGYGWDVDGENSGGLAVKGGVGLLRRGVFAPFSALGPVAIAMDGPRAWGAALRGEIADNIGLQAGWVRRDDSSGDGLFVSVDFMRCLLQDLGLAPCVVF
jgi:hypothetical protein